MFPGLGDKRTCKMIKIDLTDAGVPYRNERGEYRDWHALRHSFITRCWKSGADPSVVQKLARHSDIRLTMGYSHATDSDLRKATDAVPKIPLAPTDEDAA